MRSPYLAPGITWYKGKTHYNGLANGSMKPSATHWHEHNNGVHISSTPWPRIFRELRFRITKITEIAREIYDSEIRSLQKFWRLKLWDHVVCSNKGCGHKKLSGVFTGGKECPDSKNSGVLKSKNSGNFKNRHQYINRTIFDGFVVIFVKKTWFPMLFQK